MNKEYESTEAFLASLERGDENKSYTDYLGQFTRELFRAVKAHAYVKDIFGRFLSNESNKNEITITHKVIFASPLTNLYLYILNQIIEKDYDVIETCIDEFDVSCGPAELIDVEVNLNKFKSIYFEGHLNIENKKSKERLSLELVPHGSRPFFMIKGLKTSKELNRFKKIFDKMLVRLDFYKNKTLIFRSYGLEFAESKDVKKEDIILDDKIWENIKLNVLNVFEKTEEYKKLGIPTKRGIILEGPPGNGKSLLVKYLNAYLKNKVTFIYVTDAAIKGPQTITEIFKIARYYNPCVLVFEDVDSIGASREGFSSPLTSELLSQLDGLEDLENCVIIATTNYAEKIDEALKNRPSRFDRRIKIEQPSDMARKKILSNILHKIDDKKEIYINDEQLQSLVKITQKYSGALLEELVITAKMEAFHKNESLNINHLLAAIPFLKTNYHDNDDISKTNVGFRTHD